MRLAELRGLLTGFQMLGAEQKRISTDTLFYTENSFKALRGRLQALEDPKFFESKVAAERALQAKMAKSTRKPTVHVAAYQEIARAQDRLREIRLPLGALEYGFQGRPSRSHRDPSARGGGAAEAERGAAARVQESNLPALTQRLFSEAPILPGPRAPPPLLLARQDPRDARPLTLPQ
jgi:hypothetical protein